VEPSEPETNPTLPADEPETEEPEQAESEQSSEEELPQEEEMPASQDSTIPSLDIDESSNAFEILDAVTDVLADISPEEAVAVVSAVLDSIIGDTETLTEEDKEKVAAVVAAVIENGVTEELATELVSSPAVLESISSEQAEQIFESVNAENLDESAAAAIVEAVQDAPEAIREVFENTVDLFQGAFDNYEMVNQTISVGERRTVVAVSVVAAATAAAAAIPQGSPSPASSPSPPRSDIAARKEDEETEAQGEIAGDGVDWVKQLSIYKYVNGEKTVDWKAFIKKFGLGIFNMGFTIAGAVVLFFTVSGFLRWVTVGAFAVATAMAMYVHMLEPDND
jgi:hypothetical protein